MGWQTSRLFRCSPTDPYEARRFTGTWLLDTVRLPHGSEVVDDAELVVSELITNAVNNACSRIELALELDDTSLVVSVRDNGDGWPTPQDATPSEEHGRGLRIVGTLAQSWGVEQLADGSKRVSAVLRV